MLKKNQKVQILSSVTALLLLAILVACKGFFVNPTLESITVTPSTPSVEQGKTLHMVATGTFDDDSTSTITSSVTWTTTDGNIATIGQSTGIVTGVGLGTTSVKAESGAISSETTLSVVPANLISIQVTPTSPSIVSGGTQQFTATGTIQGGTTVDLTTVATWHSSNTDVATISASGLATAETVTADSTTIITATSVGITSNQATLTVTAP